MSKRLSPISVTLIYAVLAALWIIASDKLLAFTVGDAVVLRYLELANCLAFVAITSSLLYLLLKSWTKTLGDTATAQETDIRPIATTRLVLLFTALVLVVPLIGAAIVRLYGPQIEREAYANLEAIAKLKAEQIESWLSDRQGDGKVLIANDGFVQLVDRFMQQHADSPSDAIQKQLNALRINYDYDSILLLDTGGRLLFTLGDHGDMPVDLQQMLRQALDSKQVQQGNFYRDEQGNVHLDFVAPVFVSDAQGEHAAAVVVLRITAQRFLFPLIQTWPTSSPSAESLLVQQDGKSALFINTLRHCSNTALSLRLPLANSSLPAAVAIRSAQGIIKGNDYRNVEVLAAYRPVKGTSWHLVTKIDRDEVLAPMRELVLWISLVAFVAIIAISIAMLLLWRQQQRAQSLALLAQKAQAQYELGIVDLSLQESQLRTQALVDSALDGVITIDQDDKVIAWNPQAARIFGYTLEQALGREVAELIVPPVYREAHLQGIARFIKTGIPTIIDTRIELTGMRADGSEFPVELSVMRIKQRDGYFFSAYIRDITERKQTENELRIAATAFESQEAMFITDANQVILKVNQAFTRITGYSAEEAVGNTPAMFKSGRQNKQFYNEMWEALNRYKFWTGEIWNQRKNGELYPEWLSISAVTDAIGRISNYVAAFSDITASKKSEETIYNLAFYDSLTGLPNRRLLIERLQQAMNSSTRHLNFGAILFIDLDNFKELNDIKGYEIGDLLLIEVAKRLQLCISSNDSVACLGGDDFVVLLEELSIEADQAAAQAENIAEKIRIAISQTFKLQGLEFHNTSSIGISLFRNHEISVDDLLKHTDMAMYQAKQSGRDTIRFFDPVTHAMMEARIALGAELRLALPNNQFRLYYQMQVDSTGKVIGAEALIRWQHPERGLMSPAHFIPLTEESGLIVPIGHWVLETACAQIKRWEADVNTRHLQLAVNVSALQFRQPDFVEQVCRVLEKTVINPGNLKLELTETLVLEDVNDTIAKIQALKKLGIHFSMDDFGTGYSSLSYLSKLPLDQLKIDQSFVYNIGVNPSDAVIVQTIIGMAKNLNMEVIAEGVETGLQRDFLERNGCIHYQGYLFGKPVPLEEFEHLLRGV